MKVAGAAVLLAVVHLAVRYWLATTPSLAETYYDEALTGLMGLAILDGQRPVFYWGQPYLGAIEAYVAAAGFWLAGVSTLTLRMAEVTAALLWVWAVGSLARRIAGNACGLVAALAVAMPPIFLSFAQLSAHGQSLSVTLGAIVLAAGGALVDSGASARARTTAWLILGVAGGLGWWASQMMGMFLIAVAAGLLVARPAVLREGGPYTALAAFAAASLPFWVWNVQHDWATFRHLASWGAPLPPYWSTRFAIVGETLLSTLQGQFWDSRSVELPPAIRALGWLAIALFYVPGVILAAIQAGAWGQRLWRRKRPWQEPLDLVVLGFWLTVGAHAATWFGTSGVLRYSMTFFATLPVLGAVALARAARGRPRVAALALGAVAILLAYHGALHVRFVREAAAGPWRPVDAAIAALEQLGVRACYADSRIAQVITFESGRRIVCADHYGLRNFEFLQRVDRVDDSAAVAIVTHRVLSSPRPEEMAEGLHRIGGDAMVTRVGDYQIFHAFRPPDDRIRPIAPAAWSATASTNAATASLAFDRKVWTRWEAAAPQSQWLEVDLGRVYRLAGLTLLAAPLPEEGAAGLRVETSVNGRHWDLANEDRTVAGGLHWWKGHPRLDESGRVVLRMLPRTARYLRLLPLHAEPIGGKWSVAELFVYEVADTAWVPLQAAVTALAEARQALDHWMDDPGGPHPRRAPVTYRHRRAQVPWATVFAATERALETAPDWEEAHHLYGVALSRWGWSSDADSMVLQAQTDRAWAQVLRWTDLAETQRPDFWVSSRPAARAAALAALGRPDEAEAVRAGALQHAPPAFRARFGHDMELVGVHLAARARPGETITMDYVWRGMRSLSVDYTASVSFKERTSPGRFGHTYRIGGSFGTSRWPSGERVEERVAIAIPADAAPGLYQARVSVSVPELDRHLSVDAADLPHTSRYVGVATLEIVP